MYKVFIYDKPVFILKKPKNIGSYEQLSDSVKPQEIIEILRKENTLGCEIVSEHPKAFWKSFKTYFKFIIAAGGTVFNTNNELLVIYRLSKWDLPKGKLEKGEDISTCAVREVEEECNVTDLKIEKELKSTFHCYPLKSGKWALKRTYWYKMQSTFDGELIPQTEEGIEEVKWLDLKDLNSVLENTYLSIADVLKQL